MDCSSEGMSTAARAFILGKVFQAIPLYFAHWEDAWLGKDELDAAFEALTQEAMACRDRRCFSLLLMAFLARLNNGHTRFRDAVFDGLPPLGLALRPVEGRWTVVAGDTAGLHVGDVVQQIEEKPVESWVEGLRPYTVGSPQSRTVQVADLHGVFPPLLQLFLPDRYTIQLEDARGASQTLTVDRTALARPVAPLRTEGRWLDDHLAYIKIPSFLSPEFEARALAYVNEFRQAPCLIVDVRGNEGGNTPGALIRALMARPYRWWTESSPLNVGLLACQTQLGQNVHLFGDAALRWRAPVSVPDPDGYTGQLIILVDRATWSAAEDFVMPFKDTGRACLIGEPTGGSTGQPYFHLFQNGMAVGIGTKRAYLPDGTTFEGVGLQPDLSVLPCRDDLYAGRDPVLEAAIARADS